MPAILAFPGNDVRLRSEFQVGIHEPADFGSEIERAGKVHAACLLHADALDDHGWLDEDTTALGNAIDLLDGGDTEHEAAKDQKKGFTKARNLAANALYADCLTVQNAARLQYPGGTDASGNEKNITPRARFLLNEFPPRDRETSDDDDENDDTQDPAAPPSPPIP